MKKKLTLVLSVLSIFSFLGCAKKKEPAKIKEQGGKIKIYTTFYPACEFTKIIAGDLVDTVNPVPAGTDPAVWMPSREVIGGYQSESALIFINGAEYEKWLKKVMLPESKIIDTSKPLENDFIRIPGAVTHSHTKFKDAANLEEGKHSHEGIDGHTWLDPENAKVQASVIRNALVKLMPEKTEKIEAGYSVLVWKLNELDTMFRELGTKYKGQYLVASHPAYNYLAKRYGWKIKSFFFSPYSVPAQTDVEEFKTFVKKKEVKYLIWADCPSAEVERYFLDGYCIKSIEFSTCASPSAEEIKSGSDYFSIMKQNIQNLSVLF